MICKKDRSRISSRRTRRLRGSSSTDGSQSSKAMAQAARFIMFRRIREEKEDPYTTHPLSFEEFDNIPDIEDLIKEKEMINICDECKMSMADHTTCECCQEPMCEDEDTVDMPEGWYHPDCYSDVYG